MNENRKQRHITKQRISGTLVILAIILAIAMAGTASAKSLYLVTHHQKQFQAWNINPNGTIGWQGSYPLQHVYAPAGVAIHEPSSTLFISSECGGLEWVDANLNPVNWSQITQFAGLAVDDKRDILYAMERSGNQLYAFDFNRTTLILTLKSGFPKTLSALYPNSGMGIALDELSDPPILWVADGGNMMIRAYNTSDFSEDTSLSFSTSSTNIGAVGMGMDRRRGIIYWGSMTYGAYVPPNTGSLDLYKFDLNTKILTSQNINIPPPPTNAQVVDVSVDEDTGLVYITETGAVSVWDTTTSPWTRLDRHTLGDSGCGIAVTNAAYMPDLAVNKTDDVADGECVGVGGNIQYTVSYENTGDIDLTGVIIIDDLPAEVDHVLGGTYNSGTRQVTWNIGDLAQGATGSVQIDVQVNAIATPGSTIINYATIDSSETNPTTVQEKTDICTNQPPVADAGSDQTVEQDSLGGASVTLDGSGSYDPDNDPLTYSWTWTGGSAAGVNPTVSLPMGTTTVTLVVNDGTVDSSPDTVVIIVQDTTDPVINCPDDVTVEQATAAGTAVPLTATATDICDASPTITSDELAIYPLGVTTVTFTATDDSGNSVSCTTTVTVEDTTAPTVTITDPSDAADIWYRETIDVEYTVSDICDASPAVVVTPSDPIHAPLTLGELTIAVSATDASGNTGSDSVTVTVIGPIDLKEQAVTDLEAAKTGDKKTDKKIDDAIKHIQKSLEDKLWADELRLDTKHGKKVFDEEKKAIKDIAGLYKCKGIEDMTLEYTGTSTVDIRAYDKDDTMIAEVLGASNGDTIFIDGTTLPKGKLGPETTVELSDNTTGASIATQKIHTSCSKPLEEGMAFGDLEVTDVSKIVDFQPTSDIIEKLVQADEGLAKTAIDDAKATPVTDPKKQDKVDKEIAKAEDELAKAEDKLNEGKPDKAIDHYKKAWEHAQHAIKHAQK